ncbi:MAG: DUF4198 domain-containing protein [Synergistaceae bacterium]|nr:DUF4198 domain-containing protein [Synergistaceae bacterium]
MKISRTTRNTRNISRETALRTSVFVTAAYLALSFATPSLADVFMVFPEYSLAPAGKTVKIESTLSKSLPRFGSSGYGSVITISGFIVSCDGVENNLPEFAYANSRTGNTYGKSELGELGVGEDVIERLVDSCVSHAVMGSAEGTSIIAVTLTSSDKRCLSKAFINLTGGDVRTTSPAAYAGDDVLELVPVTDIASAQPGGKARFKLYLDGSPKSGVTVNVSSNDVVFDRGATDSAGVVELDLPLFGASQSRGATGGYCYVYSEVNDGGTTYQASVNFRLGSESIAGYVVDRNRNEAGLLFNATMRMGPLR